MEADVRFVCAYLRVLRVTYRPQGNLLQDMAAVKVLALPNLNTVHTKLCV